MAIFAILLVGYLLLMLAALVFGAALSAAGRAEDDRLGFRTYDEPIPMPLPPFPGPRHARDDVAYPAAVG